jgi:hypothetical protein
MRAATTKTLIVLVQICGVSVPRLRFSVRIRTAVS